MNASELLDAALAHHALGRPVIPVHHDKRPACPSWGEWRFRPQTEAEVRRLFAAPAHGLAVLTWPASELVVLDFDGPHAAAAWERTGIPLPPTAQQRTRGGGTHLGYVVPPDSTRPGQEATEKELKRKVRLVAATGCGCERECGVDLLFNGYFITAPTPGYQEDPDAPFEPGSLAVIPHEILDLARAADRENGGAPVRTDLPGEAIPYGRRNAALASLAGTMRRRGMGEPAILAALLEENAARCQPPLPEREVRAIAGSIAGYAPAEEKAQPAEPPRQTTPVLVRLSEVAPEAVTWLWPLRLPRAKQILVIGDPGQGKSFLALDLAARITSGGRWPDGIQAPQGDVVLLTAEDGLADTVRPRLDAMGGDPRRVHVLKAIRENDAERAFDLAQDIHHLGAAISSTRSVLAVIDPVSAYLGKTDSYRDAEVRGVLAPLAALAERTGSALLGIMHLTKNQQRQALYRAQGNIAFVGAARVVFAVAEDRESPGRRLFLPVKMNVARKPPGLAFRLIEAGAVARVEWESGPVEVDAETALGAPEPTEDRAEREQAEDFLREILATGPVEAKAVKKAARAAGVSERTLWRAKGGLGVRAEKRGFGETGVWTWELPKTATPY